MTYDLLRNMAALSGQTPRYLLALGKKATGAIVNVKGISGFAYGAGCTAVQGQAPTSGQTVADGSDDRWLGSVVTCSAGSAWVYAALDSELVIENV